ncbi:hypothetical protein P389DRAFT_68049 [Cystobasidium minutum MCA 4210]|uniref:uncharacterized protein n=1 Tax=Cystobasidium minutum MCA 4210 TaxID=1397322 RepID=UPI0034CFB0E2|eukprot:jgi/Rhomi1/68049/CE68048_976
MQDDSRQRLDVLANGYGDSARALEIETAGQRYDTHSALTESNLNRHTTLNPPDARDTVAWFLRGLLPSTDAGLDRTHAPEAGDLRNSSESQEDQTKQSQNVQPRASRGSQHSREEKVEREDASLPITAPWRPLVEQRKSLVASMKSKHDSPEVQQVPVQKAQQEAAASIASSLGEHHPRPPAAERQCHEAPALKQVRKKPAVLPQDSRKTTREERLPKRKQDDASSAHKPDTRKRQEAGEYLGETSKDARKKARRKQKAIETLAVKEKDCDRKDPVLEQRKERRRAKAVIVKERSTVTGPSEAILKANKEALKKAAADEPSKYRTLEKHVSQEKESDRAHKPTSNRSKDRKHDSREEDDDDAQHADRKRKKRSTDVQRSMRAMKESVKGRRESGKRRRNDPLERAANILPTGRVTLKAKTGIYNHGRASSKHATGVEAPSKRYLAFSELPFLNQPVGESSKARLVHKQALGAYQSIARDELLDKHNGQAYKKVQHGEFTELQSESSDSQSTCTSSSGDASISTVQKPRSRPRSPKRVNVEKHSKRRTRHDETSTSPAKPLGAKPPKQQLAAPPLHRTQGLSLETRDAGSSALTPSRPDTNESTCGNSRNLSSAAESGHLSSLTGLSAGSLVRRRLLRRMERAGSVVVPSTEHNNLQAELRVFQTTNPLGSQAHGPSAKYGTAVINKSKTWPKLDLPDLPILPKTAPVYSSPAAQIMHIKPSDRSPDWFADHDSPMAGTVPVNQDVSHHWEQSALENEQNKYCRSQEHVGQLYPQQPPQMQMSYSHPSGHLSCCCSQPRHHRPGVDSEMAFEYAPATASQPCHYYGPDENDIYGMPRAPFSGDISYGHRDTLQGLDQTPQSTHAHRPPAILPPQLQLRSDTLHDTLDTQHYPAISHELELANLDDPTRFQRGRADLQTYHPYTSSPGPLLPSRGFWQPNYL